MSEILLIVFIVASTPIVEAKDNIWKMQWMGYESCSRCHPPVLNENAQLKTEL